jgi:RNA polymerase sigma-54 factor
MKPSLQLKFSQQLTMTPQLQQAIRLLQLSTVDLQQEIQEALDSNPLLEADEQVNSEFNDDAAQKQSAEDITDNSSMDVASALENDTLPNELPNDVSWDEYLSASSAPVSNTSMASGPDDDTTYQGSTSDSLYDHLMWQMNLTHFSDVDAVIATTIIDAINDAGYLTVSTQDILLSLRDEEIDIEEVECVLKRIQHFDPVGVGARNAQECLSIQLNQYPPETPWLEQTQAILSDHIELLLSKDYRTLARKTKLKETELGDVMRLLQSLDPRPGHSVVQKEAEYVIPDVSVQKKNGRWTVELNPDSTPKININQQYAAMSKTTRNVSDGQFIRAHLQEAKWFIKSLESRNDTLMKVANCIVQQQQGFFEYGPEAMRPMVLNDVAEVVDMHESTISRVTTQKYMHTPRGIYELKYFFSSHVSTDNGGECSSTAIRALIKKLVAAENSSKPLSDNKIAQLLSEQGIQVARRTIAKYRESLSIPPSNQRKSLV